MLALSFFLTTQDKLLQAACESLSAAWPSGWLDSYGSEFSSWKSYIYDLDCELLWTKAILHVLLLLQVHMPTCSSTFHSLRTARQMWNRCQHHVLGLPSLQNRRRMRLPFFLTYLDLGIWS